MTDVNFPQNPQPQFPIQPTGMSTGKVVGLVLAVAVLVGGGVYLALSKQTNVSPSFDGVWTVQANPADGLFGCSAAAGTVVIGGAGMNGTIVTGDGVVAAVSAIVDSNGTISSGEGTNLVTFAGRVDAVSGQGTWSDAYGCAGMFTLTRGAAPVQNTQPTSDTAAPARQQSSVTTGGGSTNVQSSGSSVQTNNQGTTVLQGSGGSLQVTGSGSSATVGVGSAPASAPTNNVSGTWRGTAYSSGGYCENYAITANVSGGIMSGTAVGLTTGESASIGALVSASGAVTPGTTGAARFRGSINGSTMSGTWNSVVDEFECSGSFTLNR
jgi:hypothetical protein